MGETFRASANFTRPADMTQYAAGDLVANSATAGSVSPLTFVFESAGRPIWLRRIALTKTDPDITNSSFRLWLHTDPSVTFSNGDNGALAIGSSTLSIGSIILAQDITISASLAGAGDLAVTTFDRGLHLLPATIYGFLEARGTYTPGNAEVFAVELRGETF